MLQETNRIELRSRSTVPPKQGAPADLDMHFLDGGHENGSRYTPRKVERSSRAKICDVQCIQMHPANLPKTIDPGTQRRLGGLNSIDPAFVVPAKKQSFC